MKPHVLLTTALIALSTGVTSGVANASVISLPSASAYASATVPTTVGVEGGTIGPIGQPGVGAFTTGIVYYGINQVPETAVAAANTYSGVPVANSNANQFGNSQAYEKYWFEIAGPQALSNIPVTETGFMSANANNINAASYSYVSINSGSLSYECTMAGAITGCSNYTAGGIENNNFKTSLSLSSNTAYEVTVYTEAFATAPSSFANGYADPFMAIDSSFLTDNPGYSLAFSSGIVNAPVSSVPLPASLPMFAALIAGMVGFAHFGRQRRGCAIVA